MTAGEFDTDGAEFEIDGYKTHHSSSTLSFVEVEAGFTTNHHIGFPELDFVDPWQEHCDHEEGARYDDVRERYWAEIREAKMEAAMYEAECQEQEALYALVCFFTGYKPEPVAPAVVDVEDDDIPF